MKNNNGKLKLIGLIITLAVLFAGVVATLAVYGENLDDNTDAITELEQDGCAPAEKNRFDIALIQKDIATIQKTQTEMRLEQKKGFKEILDRLPRQIIE